ncbi:MAG: hypothetical protein P8N43_06905 [Alphaproteobacteria bacterium]|jgi:hypothetical protein|nr:hypothetical protein [Alphaproteobacteria bacterium]
MGRFVKNPEIGDNASAVKIPSVTTAQRPSGVNGQIIFNTTTSTYQAYNGSAWYNISEASRQKTITIDRFQGDGTTTTFGNGAGSSIDDSTSATFSVGVSDATDIMVFVGGVYQVPTTNYSIAGSGTTATITFGSAPPGNDGTTGGHIVTIVHGLDKLGE